MSEEKPLNVPEYLLIRSAEARAKHLGISVEQALAEIKGEACLLYTSPSPRDATLSRMPSSA